MRWCRCSQLSHDTRLVCGPSVKDNSLTTLGTEVLEHVLRDMHLWQLSCDVMCCRVLMLADKEIANACIG